MMSATDCVYAGTLVAAVSMLVYFVWPKKKAPVVDAPTKLPTSAPDLFKEPTIQELADQLDNPKGPTKP
jgi:hypothetical protein